MSKRTNSEIKAAIEANAKLYFKALTDEDFTKAATIEKTMNEDRDEFNAQSKQALLDKHDTFLAFLRDPSYDTIMWTLVRDDGVLTDIEVKTKPRDITVQDVLKKVKPAASNWYAYAEQLTLRLDLKVAEDIGLSVQQRKEIEETLYMRRGGRSVELGQLDSNASIDKAIKLTITAMTDEVSKEEVEEAIKSYDRKFLIYSATQRGGKSKMRFLDTKKIVNFVFLDIMGAHWANRPYTVDYRKDNDLAAAGAAVTVENPKPKLKSESKTKTEKAPSKPSTKGKGDKRITKKDNGGDVAAA